MAQTKHRDDQLFAEHVEFAAGVSSDLVAAGSALTLTAKDHAGRTIALDTAAGSTVTLPAATGTGDKYKFLVSVTVTTNDHIVQVANATDEFAGTILQTDTDTTDTLASYPALVADNFDTVTMNGTTKGGLIGDVIEIVDVAAGTFAINGHINANGVVATPFGALVS